MEFKKFDLQGFPVIAMEANYVKADGSNGGVDFYIKHFDSGDLFFCVGQVELTLDEVDDDVAYSVFKEYRDIPMVTIYN